MTERKTQAITQEITQKKAQEKAQEKAQVKWLAGYLYYSEPWEPFLTETVKPFIKTAMAEEGVNRYFFIRYWERGPHIRLRFKGNAAVLENLLKPRLNDYFNDYFRREPSEQEPIPNLEKIPPEFRWFPNNSVQYIEYEPEIERYGGPSGILTAESQFEISSDAVLALIEEAGDWDYDRALGAAIQLHLGFAFAMGMDLDEAKEFFSHVSRLWFSRAYISDYNQELPPEETKERQEATNKAFEENFERQKPILVPYHETLWNAFQEETEFEQEWLNNWLNKMTAINTELRQLQKKNRLEFHKWFKPNPQRHTPEERQLMWTIIESYVHMTNNRLGILNRDEAFLGYLIKKSLDCIGG